MSLITNINKAFDHRIRLGIMSILMVNEKADFKELKELLGATDGVQKSFIGRKPNTSYSVTRSGKTAFKKHIEALEKLLGHN